MRHNPYPVMLFAAGFGTRMGALTLNRPKPLIPVAGRALIDHALDLAILAGSQTMVANLHYKSDMLAQHLRHSPVDTIIEAPEILDTGGGLKNALSILDHSPVITMNTDAIWIGENPIDLLINNWNPDKMDALLVSIPRSSAHGHMGNGDFHLAQDGQLLRGGDLIYGGVQIIKTNLLHDVRQACFSLNVVWNQMAAADRLFGLEYPGQWCDVGHPEGIDIAEKMIANANV
jgi:MurNAc alpha-1-phosphate uridylyltransferase